MFAVIKTGGKQYLVHPGLKVKIEKLDASEGGDVVFDEVLLVADGAELAIGAPRVAGAKVEAHVIKQARSRKVIVFKYHPKTRYRKLRGHRQPYTEVEINKVVR